MSDATREAAIPWQVYDQLLFLLPEGRRELLTDLRVRALSSSHRSGEGVRVGTRRIALRCRSLWAQHRHEQPDVRRLGVERDRHAAERVRLA